MSCTDESSSSAGLGGTVALSADDRRSGSKAAAIGVVAPSVKEGG